jgi:hypothetical protein
MNRARSASVVPTKAPETQPRSGTCLRHAILSSERWASPNGLFRLPKSESAA